jgi:Protein of unknown function (DUF2934)
MEAEKDATKGNSEKRTVRKSKTAKAASAPEADLKAAAEGADQAVPGPAETPAKPRGKGVRTVSKGAVAKEAKTIGAPREAKRKATRRKPDPSPATEAPSSPSAAEPAPEITPVAVETVVLEQSPGAAPFTAEPPLEGERGQLDEPTFEQIQLRAYFIAERRQRAGLPGDDQSDWLHAREELLNELKGH